MAFSDLFINEEFDTDDEINIVKTKRFAVKPMDPEEACVQMELLGHSFYVFLNAETEQVNVVYKRKNNTYGLIEPEFE
jgi:putative sigma-54 modulation protein